MINESFLLGMLVLVSVEFVIYVVVLTIRSFIGHH